jgi:hypothetical protein
MMRDEQYYFLKTMQEKISSCLLKIKIATPSERWLAMTAETGFTLNNLKVTVGHHGLPSRE